jgi:hypothetical protein
MTFVTFGQTTESSKQLLDSTTLTKNTRTIILLENDTFVVFTTYKLFVYNFKLFIKEHDLDWDKDLLKLFTTNNSKIIYADSLTKTNMNKSRLIFRMANLLESGQCLVYNKQKKILEKLVDTEIYTTSFIIGRRIKTKEKYLILETVDGVN